MDVLGYNLDSVGMDITFRHPRRFAHLHGVISAPGEFQIVSCDRFDARNAEAWFSFFP